jgi:hypothetical protein
MCNQDTEKLLGCHVFKIGELVLSRIEKWRPSCLHKRVCVLFKVERHALQSCELSMIRQFMCNTNAIMVGGRPNQSESPVRLVQTHSYDFYINVGHGRESIVNVDVDVELDPCFVVPGVLFWCLRGGPAHYIHVARVDKIGVIFLHHHAVYKKKVLGIQTVVSFISNFRRTSNVLECLISFLYDTTTRVHLAE